MNRNPVNETVLAELEHIPEHPKEYQSELRAYYWTVRTKDLGKNGDPSRTPGDALRRAVAFIRKDRPAAVLHYDDGFFGIG